MAPNLEVLDLQYAPGPGAAEELRSILAVLPHLQVLLMDDISGGVYMFDESDFAGMTGGVGVVPPLFPCTTTSFSK